MSNQSKKKKKKKPTDSNHLKKCQITDLIISQADNRSTPSIYIQYIYYLYMYFFFYLVLLSTIWSITLI